MLTVVNEDGTTPHGSLIDDIVREGARRMLTAALEAEVNAYIADLADQRDESGRRLVVRNGFHQPRKVTTAAGAIEVKAPRVNDKRVDQSTGERRRFSSAILPPWARKSPKISEVLPLLYLHGLSSGDFVPALEQFLGSSAGLSPATVTRLTTQWQADHKAFGERDLSATDYVYVWADGIHLRIRLSEAKSCVLVVMGVRADGTKELIAMADGYRESAESWADLLRDCSRRGMRAQALAVGDGALGFWKALAEVFPETRHQRCWVHKTANVLNAILKSAQPGRGRRCRTSTTPRTASTRSRPSPHSRRPTARSGPRPSRRSPTTWTSCWCSTTSRPSTGFTCAQRIPSNRPSRRCGCGPRSPRAPAARPPRLPWSSRRVRPGALAGGQRTAPRRPRPRRSPLRTRPPRRTPRDRGSVTTFPETPMEASAVSDLDSQTAYWDAAATTKRFTHPLHTPWLDNVERSAAILDYGCGYGRTLDALEQQGFDNLSGVDTSPGMIARARSLHPAMHFAVLDTPPTLACPDASIDVVVLFAVLTCIPSDDAQRLLIGELHRVLKPGALLYLSDLLLQDDQRNRDRYARFAEPYGTYGVFETGDGAVCRHHPSGWFTSLLAGFETIDTRRTTVTTMNGNTSAGLQILARKPVPGHQTPTH